MESTTGNSVKITAIALTLSLAILFNISATGDPSQCTWRLISSTTSPGIPDPAADYYWFNTTITKQTAFVLTGSTLPTTGYFAVAAYVNGVPLKHLPDYKIVTSSGENPYPAPGTIASTPMGTATPYSFSIGAPHSSPNYFAIPPDAVGKQIEIALRFYSPHIDLVLPNLTSADASTGAPTPCPAYELLMVDLSLLSGYTATIAQINGEEIQFVRVAGAGLYPDADGYLGAAMKYGVTLIAFPKPPFPPCVGNGCFLDRRNGPAYSSLVAANFITVTQSSVSDRNLSADAEGVAYLAVIPPILGINPGVAAALKRNGFSSMNSQLAGNTYFAHRQKVTSSDYRNSFTKVPSYPPTPPAHPERYAAARFIDAAPVAVYCNPNPNMLRQCIEAAKGRLRTLRASYAAIRAGGETLN